MNLESRKHSLLYIVFAAVLLLGGLHIIATGLYLYWTVGWFDNLMHFLGGFCIGLLSIWVIYLSGIKSRLGIESPSVKKAILTSVVAVIIIGIGWEIFEYANGLTESTESYPLDVLHDLISDILGSILAGIIGSRKELYL